MTDRPTPHQVPYETTTLDELSLREQHARMDSVMSRGFFGRLMGYVGLSGPGWLQSAITLGGGSLASSLFLGIIGGYSLLWIQPIAMILGIIMLSAIGYVTLSTGERPFHAINQHVNPVLGWGWAIAVMAANIVWCLPQYALASGVTKNILVPSVNIAVDDSGNPVVIKNAVVNSMGADHWAAQGDHPLNLVIVGVIFLITLLITSCYGRGGWGLKIYELILKLLVAFIVLSFVGVVIAMSWENGKIDWNQILQGLIPNLDAIRNPAPKLQAIIDKIPNDLSREYWTKYVSTGTNQ